MHVVKEDRRGASSHKIFVLDLRHLLQTLSKPRAMLIPTCPTSMSCTNIRLQLMVCMNEHVDLR